MTPDSPASRASIQKGDILVGMNVGQRKWETIRPDNVLFILDQIRTGPNRALQFYAVRRNEFVEGVLSIAAVHRGIPPNASATAPAGALER